MTFNFVFFVSSNLFESFWFLKTFAYLWGEMGPKIVIVIDQISESLIKVMKMEPCKNM